MLSNPWTAEPGTPLILGESPVPAVVASWVASRLGGEPTRGFGYLSWVFLGPHTVLRVDPVPGRPDRFLSDLAVSGVRLPGVAIPEVLDSGEFDGRAWVEITRLSGEPAHLTWLGRDRPSRHRFMGRLAEAVRVLHQHVPDERLIPRPTCPWPEHVGAEAEKSLRAAYSVLPASYRRGTESAFARWHPALTAGATVLAHGDLWLGNLLVDGQGELTGLLDFDRAALAPPDYELDMLLRFWQYPWNFVPRELESAYAESLDFADLTPVVTVCAAGLPEQELADRLSTLELIYRLGKIAPFGWSDEARQMLDTVLDDRWCEGLTQQ